MEASSANGDHLRVGDGDLACAFQVHVRPKRRRGMGVLLAVAETSPRLPLLVTAVISEQTNGFMDVDRRDGERIRLRFRGDAARQPDVAAGLVRLLAADGNMYEAVTKYASGFGLAATYFLGSESVIIDISEPPSLTPLVNASGGSPRSRASRHSKPARRPLARLLRLRTPTGLPESCLIVADTDS